MAGEPGFLFWERQPNESAKAYHAFTLYRDAGITRSLRKVVGEHFGGSTGKLRQLEKWSSENLWVSRVEAYDAEVDRRRRLRREAQAEDARERAVENARLLQDIAIRGLEQLQGRSKPTLNPSTSLLRYLKEGTELEFVSLGLPFHLIKQEVEEKSEDDREVERRINTYRSAGDLL